MILQYPVVQTYAAQKLAKYLTIKVGYPIYINKMELDWFDQLKLMGVYIKETDGIHTLIGIEELAVDYHFKTLYSKGKIFLDDVRLEGADVNLVIYQDSVMNIKKFIAAIAGRSNNKENITTSHSKDDILHVKDIYIRNSHFSYNDYTIAPDTAEEVFDYAHFSVKNINIDVSGLQIGDTIAVQVDNLSLLEEYSGFRIKTLSTHFKYWEQGLSFAPLYGEFNNSIIRDTVIMSSMHPDPYGDFMNRMRIEAKLRKSVIDLQDIGYFVPSFKKYHEKIYTEGSFRGTINKFSAKNLDLRIGVLTRIKGNISMDGLPDIDETFMNFQFKESKIYANDIVPYLTPYQASILRKFETIDFKANFLGVINDFVADGQFSTKLGYLDTDINFKTANNYYKGKLITQNFNLGRLWDMPDLVQRITMNGRIEGTGLTLATASLKTDASIKKLGINQYDYENIQVNGRLSKQLFNGELDIKDKNLSMVLDGIISFKDSTFRFNAQIDTANLHTLNIMPDSSFIHSQIEADFTGLTPEDIQGSIVFRELFMQHLERSLALDSFYISTHKDYSQTQGIHRDIQIHSELFHIIAEGNYQINQLVNDVSNLADEYKLSISKDTAQINTHYAERKKKKNSTSPYKLDFNAKFRNVNPLLQLFVSDFSVAPNTKFYGNLEIGNMSSFEMSFVSDSVRYQNYWLGADTVILYTAKKYDSPDFEFESTFRSQKQEINGFHTEKLMADIYRHNDIFHFNSYLKNAGNTDEMILKGTFELFNDRYELNLTNTEFLIMENKWDNAGINKLIYYKENGKVEIEDMHFANNKQMFRLDGFISQDSTDKLHFSMHDIDIAFLGSYLSKPIRGVADIDASIANLYGKVDIEAKAMVDSLFLRKFYIGTLKATSAWNENNNKFDLRASIERYGKTEMSLFGLLDPSAAAENQLDITMLLQGISIQIIEPFVDEYISEIDGFALGYLKLKGNAGSPRIKGDVLIQEGQFKVNYLGTLYKFNDKILLKEDQIEFKRFRLNDKSNNTAIINGKITHQDFNNPKLDLSIDIRKFCVLDKPFRKPDDLYYGTAIGTGNLAITGSTDNVFLAINATIIEGTKLYLPLDSYATVEKSEFIEFINPHQKDTIVKKTTDLSGIQLDFNLDIKPESYCEIILDQQTGDIIKGYAEGKLKMIIDTKGEFLMLGNVEIVKGSYTFTLLNAMNKKFDVKKGSRISWNGDPLKAQMNVTATYEQRVSFAPLMSNLDSSVLNRPEIRRRYPASVVIKMKGEVLTPEISFDITFSDYPSVVMAGATPVSIESYVQAFRQRIRNDESEMNKQVFSLIVLKRLLSDDSGFSGTAAAGSSLSELLSNQISYWVSQVDENLEISIDVGDQGVQSINLRLSYNFLDGRLRVTRDGDFGNGNSGGANQVGATNPIGNWSLEYMITPDGELRARMYSRQNLNAFNANLGATYTSGVSLQHAKSFNNLGELLGIKKAEPTPKKGTTTLVPSEKELEKENEY